MRSFVSPFLFSKVSLETQSWLIPEDDPFCHLARCVIVMDTDMGRTFLIKK